MGYISIFCLLFVAIACTALVFDHGYRDTLLERIGLSMISIWAVDRIIVKLENPQTEPLQLILHLGMGCLAVVCICRRYKITHILVCKMQHLLDR